jgi:hypothetical protein
VFFEVLGGLLEARCLSAETLVCEREASSFVEQLSCVVVEVVLHGLAPTTVERLP